VIMQDRRSTTLDDTSAGRQAELLPICQQSPSCSLTAHHSATPEMVPPLDCCAANRGVAWFGEVAALRSHGRGHGLETCHAHGQNASPGPGS
jgi:hypothetical protein